MNSYTTASSLTLSPRATILGDCKSGGIKDTNEMLADFLREVSALVLVFVPLEMAIRDHTWQQMFYWTLCACGISGIALLYGVVLERGRSDDARKRISDAWRLPVTRVFAWVAKRKTKNPQPPADSGAQT
jgi:hypothetical protein